MPNPRILKLLLVEDSLDDQQLLCDALIEIEETRQWCGWRSSSVTPVDRLADGLDCLHRDSFNAILLNLSLPDSPSLLDSFLDIRLSAGSAPIVVLADEPDETLANRLLREGAQDVLVKSELECTPLARAIRHGIERQRRLNAAQVSAIVDPLTGVLTRAAFLHVAASYGPLEWLAFVEVCTHREALDPLLIDVADELRTLFHAPAIVGRWDGCRFSVLAEEAELRRAASQASTQRSTQRSTHRSTQTLRFSITRIEEVLSGEFPLRAKTAMLAD